MKRTISFLIIWLVVMHTCVAQITPEEKKVTINIEDVTDTVARYNPAEHKEISLDLLVGENQKFIKKLGGGFVETPSPVAVRSNPGAGIATKKR